MKTKIKSNEIKKALKNKHGWMPAAEIQKGDYIISVDLGVGRDAPYFYHIIINYKTRAIAEFAINQYMKYSDAAKIINRILTSKQ